ncbi:uncharacterized protein LOC116935628 [Daphnia magna]|uniref:uncharacterized protein LOC116935628 n=1 Tax=Daphnia magna TaxID=35525 RepID=UPI001E1BB96D|nr:uncharacterized protein LOC116935628 [Daphnia magna]
MAPTTKGSRTVVKGHITKTINLINGLKAVMTQEELSNLEILETKLKGCFETYKGYSTAIQDELNDADADQAEYDAETDITYQTQDEAAITRDIITQVIAAIPTPQAPVVHVTAAAPPQSTHSMRLPQRQIKHFKGDILEWTQFWESFNAAIHSSTLTNVQKFDYLTEYLKGEANLMVNNLELTDANYQVAIDELTRRYGKKQVMIDAHFNKLHTLQPVKDGNDVPALRSFQLNLQLHISALETLGAPTSSFGGLLAKPFSPPLATASQLAVGAKSNPALQVKPTLKSKSVKFSPSWIECERPCKFCGQIHWLTRCPKDLAERKSIINNLKKCVNCFGGKHELKDCTSPRNCNKCGGRQYSALCDKGDIRVSKPSKSASIVASNSISATTACASTFGQLMLKTATVIVNGPDGSETRAILFADDGSHRSWVLKSLSSQLKLKTVAVENISTRVFKKNEASQPEMTKTIEMQVRST